MNRIAAAGLGFVAALGIGTASAQEAKVGIELNKLEPAGEACRAYLVFENRTARSFDPYKLDLVMFDTDGVIAKRVAVEAGPLPAGKTSVKLFDIDRLGCGRIQRVLLNSVMACGTESEDGPGCTALASPSSRTEAKFIK
jgi:hypothetical protein